MTTLVDFGEVDPRKPISPKSAARLTMPKSKSINGPPVLLITTPRPRPLPVDFGEVDLRKPISPKSAARLTMPKSKSINGHRFFLSPLRGHDHSVDFGEVDHVSRFLRNRAARFDSALEQVNQWTTDSSYHQSAAHDHSGRLRRSRPT